MVSDLHFPQPPAVKLIVVSTYSYVPFGIVRPISIEIGLDDAVDVSFSKAIKNLDSHLRSLAFLSSYLHTSPPATSFYKE